ncbi:alpha/beta hydrolase [Salinibacterium sp. ZJ77]|uniref:alpha/beta fold hydrolase n=1 Tax=Salinibacterium sp. ZJ77 TaxID=2708337 RepID=UPI0014208248|nr:alpha/beta hydrolase [Salinibacterium sp. ZJ77]
MSRKSNTTVVLVHGAFADNSSWNGVIERLAQSGVRAFAAANPLRSLTGDAEYVADVVRSVNGPVVLVGHSYGGMVTTQAAASLDNVEALVYVGAFAPETGESAVQLTALFPGSSLAETVSHVPLSSGFSDLSIHTAQFHEQFCADLGDAAAALMEATQRPISDRALSEPLSTSTPAWRRIPAWFVFGGSDKNIPAAAMAFFAERAGSNGTTVVEGASHAVGVSQPDVVTRTILAAITGGPPVT